MKKRRYLLAVVAALALPLLVTCSSASVGNNGREQGGTGDYGLPDNQSGYGTTVRVMMK